MTDTFRFENAPFRLSGPRIKAGFHCHTVNSDGGLSPRETAALYHAKGYRCLGITDHRQVTACDGHDAGLTLIPSTENGGQPDVIGVGVREPAPKELPLPERAARLARQGGFTIAAHPAHCAVLPEAYAQCSDLMAMEIYNAYHDDAYANGYALELWDMVLGLGKRIWGVAGDDAHLNPQSRYYSDAGFGWVELWVAEPSQGSVLDALKQGAFFSTQGLVFEEIAVNERAISIRCSPVRQVRWRTLGKMGFVDHAPEGATLNASALPGWCRPTVFVRIELVDSRGKRAWSNPIFVETPAQKRPRGNG